MALATSALKTAIENALKAAYGGSPTDIPTATSTAGHRNDGAVVSNGD